VSTKQLPAFSQFGCPHLATAKNDNLVATDDVLWLDTGLLDIL
jgi:hypothetical protein